MTWKDKLEIGLKDDAPYRKDNLPEDEVRGPQIPAGPDRSPEIPMARLGVTRTGRKRRPGDKVVPSEAKVVGGEPRKPEEGAPDDDEAPETPTDEPLPLPIEDPPPTSPDVPRPRVATSDDDQDIDTAGTEADVDWQPRTGERRRADG